MSILRRVLAEIRDTFSSAIDSRILVKCFRPFDRVFCFRSIRHKNTSFSGIVTFINGARSEQRTSDGYLLSDLYILIIKDISNDHNKTISLRRDIIGLRMLSFVQFLSSYLITDITNLSTRYCKRERSAVSGDV